MSGFKIFYIVWYVLIAIPTLGYARYLHDEEENRAGAAAVFLLTVIAGMGVYSMGR